MLESISEIKKKVRPYKYLPKEGTPIDVEALVAKLRADSKFSKFSGPELYQYAYGLMAQRQNEIFKYGLAAATISNNGKPKDTTWSQYTYQELIAMEENGVLVPDDFLDWAHAMHDADTVSYQIESETEDSNSFENLDNENGSVNKSEIQKKAQAFASKALAQETLIQGKTDDSKAMSADVQDKQNEIVKQQQLSLGKVEDMATEFTALDNKFQKGEDLTDVEQKRYKELGTLLNGQQNDIAAQADSLNSDIDALMNQMDKISGLIDINERIGGELEDVGLRLAGLEGGEKKAFLPNYKNTGVSGLSASFYYAALGNNMSAETAITNSKLHFDTMDVQHKLNTEVSISEMASRQSVEVKNVAKQQDNNQVNPQANVQVQNPKQTEDGNNAQPETVTDTTQTTAADNAGAAAGADETAQTAPVTDTGEATPTTDTTDPLEAETRAYVEDCASKNDEMMQAEEALQPVIAEVAKIKKTQKLEDAKLEKELKESLKEYNALLKKVNGGNDLSKTEMTRFDQLGKLLNSKNGKYVAQMQEKVDTLTGFSQELEKDIALSVENIQYGEIAVAKGKEYAKSILGDREQMLNSSLYMRALTKEEKYDFLYGKAGESVGRDAIDGGESLTANADASNSRLSKSLPLSAFATDYSGVLTEKISSTNKEVNTMDQQFNAAFKKNAEKKASEEASQNGEVPQIPQTQTPQVQTQGQTQGQAPLQPNSNESKTTTKKDEDKKVTAADGKSVEKDGKDVKKEGENAKKDGADAKKDKQDTDKQIKQETSILKQNERRIKAFTADAAKINKKMEDMAAEVETILQSESQQSEEPAQAPVQPVQPVAMNSRAMANGTNPQSPATRSANAAAPVSAQSASTGGAGKSAENTAKLQSISGQLPQLQKQMSVNGKNITTLQKSSTKKTKSLNKLYVAKHKSAMSLAKKEEESVKKNEKLQGAITKVGYVFTGTKIAGQALMLMPWSAAAGAIMFSIGKYGEVACYVTNAAIDVANGNYLGALVNVGAAALSFASGPVKLNAGTEAVKGAAEQGVKEVAEEGTKQVVEQGVQQAATQVTTNAAGIVSTPITQAAQGGLQAAYAGAGEMMKQTAATATKQVAQEAAKTAAKEALKQNLINGGLQAAGGVMQSVGQKAGQEDSQVEDKKQRKFISYAEKKKRKSQLNKVQNSNKVSMQRGNKQNG